MAQGSFTKDEFWSELDSLGEEEVETRIRTKRYGDVSDKRSLAEQWLARKHQERTESLAREQNSIARDAADAARSAADAAWEAAREAKAANVNARIAQAIAAIAIAVSIIGFFVAK